MGNQQPVTGAPGDSGDPRVPQGGRGGHSTATGGVYSADCNKGPVRTSFQAHGQPGQHQHSYGQSQPHGHGHHPSHSQKHQSQQQQSLVGRSSSDTSMTMMDANQITNINMDTKNTPDPIANIANFENWLDDDAVPTVFRWEHGGRQVYITGTFNGWSRQIPMHRSGNDFTYIHNLKRGKHAFKFIVDDEWRFAPDQPTVADIEGRINNFIDVTDFKPYTGDREFEKEKAAAEYGCYSALPDEKTDDGHASGNEQNSDFKEDGLVKSRPDRDGETFAHNMPDLDEYTKEPPPLPPHLRHIILNKPPQLQDTAALPVPQHVALNHLYCTAIKDNMMVLGITQRFKTKFVTTVYYSPCSSK